MSDHVEISTLISFGLHEEVRNRARKLDIGVKDYLRLVILADLGFVGRPPEALGEPTLPPLMSAAPSRKKAAHDPGNDSVIDLVARGFKPQQIATMKRMSYAAVMEELGAGIDKESRAERETHQ